MKFFHLPFPRPLKGLGLGAGSMQQVTDTIQRALESAGIAGPKAPQRPFEPQRKDDPSVIDVVAREIDPPKRTAPTNEVRGEPAAPLVQGRSIAGTFTGASGTRNYQLYVPAGTAVAPRPLVVMLHGCTQSPDDFAAGTRMNELADRHGFMVAYPAQSANANGSRCWNWFRSQDQARDGGEPALIAGIVRDVTSQHAVDPKQVFVTGLSAGGAMAVILGQTYPELFAAIGVHSGLPYGAAHDMPSAFSAMSSGPRSAPPAASLAPFVPTIVFHGDRDSTVTVGNGAEVVAQALARARDARPAGAPAMKPVVTESLAAYDRSVYADAAGRPLVEQWVLHGAGHAWSGGSSAGSFTDPKGPDASEAMVRFFLAQQASQSDR